MSRFNTIFKEQYQLLENTGDFNLGIFVGGFKPPHKGHFYTALGALGLKDDFIKDQDCICDHLMVIITGKSRFDKKDDISIEVDGEMSKDIWQLYVNRYNVFDRISPTIARVPAPVIEVENKLKEIIHDDGITLNNQFIKIENLNIHLIIGEKDEESGDTPSKRYQYFIHNDNHQGNFYKNIDNSNKLKGKIKECISTSDYSASDVRSEILNIAMKAGDAETMISNEDVLNDHLPDDVNVEEVWDILRRGTPFDDR
jgi:hypothetical protein